MLEYYIDNKQYFSHTNIDPPYDELGRNDGPTLISYFDNGNIEYTEYYHNGKLHNNNGPAYIQYDELGRSILEYWFNKGRHHRIGLPAVINTSYHNKIVVSYYYYRYNKLHRVDGPAYCIYKNNKELKQCSDYYIKGKNVSKEAVEFIMNSGMGETNTWTPEFKTMWKLKYV